MVSSRQMNEWLRKDVYGPWKKVVDERRLVSRPVSESRGSKAHCRFGFRFQLPMDTEQGHRAASLCVFGVLSVPCAGNLQTLQL